MGRFTDYATLTKLVGNEVVPIVDVNDTSMSAQGTSKQITASLITSPVGLHVPNASFPTVRALPNGDILVVPYTYLSSSGDDGAAINAAFNLLPTRTEQYGSHTVSWTYGRVWLAPYQYSVATMINKPPQVDLIGAGQGTELLGTTAGMTVLYSHSTDMDDGLTSGGPPPSNAQHICGTIRDLRIDGTSAGNNAVGLDIGDGRGHEVSHVGIVNFVGTGSIGMQMCNRLSWTEKCYIRGLHLLNNSIAGVFTTFAGPNNNLSLEYNDIELNIITQHPGQQGLILQGGAFMSGGSLRVRGNFQSGFGGGSTGPVLTITGSDGGTPTNYSYMHSQFVDINVESNGGATNPPQTINFGGSNNNMLDCTGILSFRIGTWVASNAVSGQFTFGGVVQEVGTSTPNLNSVNAAPAGWQ